MVEANISKCTLRFESYGDLKSAQKLAEENFIPFEIEEEGLVSVPADKVRLFTSLGSVYFGITVGEC
ncbi:MAG: hypothetical protein RBS77_01310 [Candidatus Moranbacteria bacterium]|jgi:hypothetical protein|nr:hypothetical protein [Candidatus Moranbacteria bacterium]